MANLHPGREMDALVAEKVMGWKWRGSSHSPATLLPSEWDGVAWGSATPTGFVRPYSTNIEAAWEVFEKLIAIRPDLDLGKRHVEADDGESYPYLWAVIRRDAWSAEEYVGWGETAPEAICRAALKIF